MSSKTADKLLILQDAGLGLMARLYNLYNFEKPNHLTQLEKVCSHLTKKFPEYPDGLEKIQGWDVFQKKSLELAPILRDYYLTFLDVIEWRSAAWAVLEDCKNIIDLQFHTNQSLTCNFFDLIVMYFQLHVMIEKIPEKKLLLTVYARAHHCIEANSEPNFSRIAIFVNEFNENPIRKLQDDFEPLASRIIGSLLPLTQYICKWSDPKPIRDTKVFDLLEKIDESNFTGDLSIHTELMWLESMKRWVLVGCLISPSELQKDGALFLLQQVLSDTWLLPIFRDQHLEIHTQFRELYGRYKLNKWVFNEDVNKDFVKNGVNAAVGNSGLVHAQHRVQLRWYLKNLALLLEGHPGFCAPKFSLILAMLACAKAELHWFFLHQNYFAQPNFVIPKSKSQFNHAHYDDNMISELIYLVDKIQQLVSLPECVQSVKDYHIELLLNFEVPRLREVMEMLKASGKLNPTVHQSLEAVDTSLRSLNNESLRSDPDKLETVRMILFRVVFGLSISSANMQAKMLKDVCVILNPICIHSRHVDQPLAELVQFSSMSQLWFFNSNSHNSVPFLDRVFETSLGGSKGQPGHCIAFIRLLNSSLENVHRFCPEEQKIIGMHAMRLSQQYLKILCQAVDDFIHVIMRKEQELADQCSPYSVLSRMHLPEESRKMPGYESEYVSLELIKDLRLARKIVAEICGAFRANPTIIVFDHEYCPHEFLMEKLTAVLRLHIRKTVHIEGMPTIEQPTKTLTKLRLIISSYSLISQHIAIDIHDIIKQAILLEFSDNWTGGTCGEKIPESNIVLAEKSAPVTSVSNASHGNAPTKAVVVSDNCIGVISKFYSQTLFASYFGAHGVMHSDYAKCFEAREYISINTQDKKHYYNMERFTDVQELNALALLSGPNGIRCIEKDLLTVMSRHISIIKDFMAKFGKQNWEQLSARYAEERFWREIIHSGMNSADLAKVSALSITVGCMLRLRKDFKYALNQVTKVTADPLYALLNDVHSRLGPLTVQESFGEKTSASIAMSHLEQLCEDAGLTSFTDSRFRSAMFKVLSSVGPNFEILNYLPEFFGCIFGGEEMRGSSFSYAVLEDGFRNNVHLLADCAVSMVTCYTVYSLAAPYLTSLAAVVETPPAPGSAGRGSTIRFDLDENLVPLSAEELEGVTLDTERMKDSLKKAVVLNLQKLIRCVALAVLTIKPPGQNQSQDNPSDQSRQHIVLPILDSFIRASKGFVSPSFLEDIIPYSLARHNFVTISAPLVRKFDE